MRAAIQMLVALVISMGVGYVFARFGIALTYKLLPSDTRRDHGLGRVLIVMILAILVSILLNKLGFYLFLLMDDL